MILLPNSDSFAGRLLADASDGLAQYKATMGRDLEGDVLDIGAHYGAFALTAAVTAGANVVAVEAALANYTALRENIAANGMEDHVAAIYAAAYETNATTVELRKAAHGNSGQYSIMFGPQHPVTDSVVVIPFTTLLSRARWAYVKIDVEGAEWSLLRGPADVKLITEHAEFIDLEIHPLDNREYYPETDTPYSYVDVVGEWFRAVGARVIWTVNHPTRLFIAQGG